MDARHRTLLLSVHRYTTHSVKSVIFPLTEKTVIQPDTGTQDAILTLTKLSADILIDLNGWTIGERAVLLAARPATLIISSKVRSVCNVATLMFNRGL